jgi:hypothetical protein
VNTRTVKILCALLFLLIFYHGSSLGFVVKLTDLHTMAKHSDIVIHGYVGEQRVSSDNLGRPITLTDIEVIDGLYGAKTGDVVTVYQVGGGKDGVVMPILGGQKYHVGQELILFGLKLGNTYVSYGAGQGKLDIIQNEGKEMVIEDLGDVVAVGAARAGMGRLYHPSPLDYPSKSMIMNEIRLMIKYR